MKRVLLGLAVGLAVLAGTSAAEARPVVVVRESVRVPRPYARTYYDPTPYYRTYGVPYGASWSYPGRSHYHWEYRTWSPRFGRYHYWDPYLRAEYFYCPVRGGFYPAY